MAFLACVGFLSACTSSTPPPFRELRAGIDAAVAKGDVPSLAIAIAVDGRIVWEYAAGWADRERRVRATPDTIYPVASVAKPFTATGVMLLVERGQVDLDRPANDHLRDTALTGYAGDASGATIRRILQHRAGLPAHGQYFYADEPYTTPPVAETIRRYGIVTSPPGDRFIYSNLGYGVIAYITAQAAGKPYPDFMKQEVFEPLGLTRTSVQIGPALTLDAAVSYTEDGQRLPYYRFDEWGSGRVFSTVRDLVRFGLFHIGSNDFGQRPVLRPRTIERMRTESESTGRAGALYGPEWFYALGWGGRAQTQYNPMWFGHDGAMPGVSAELRIVPAHGTVVAVVSNTRTPLIRTFLELSLDAVLPQYAQVRLTDPIVAASLTVPVSDFASVEGRWRGVVKTWSGDVAARLKIERSGLVHLQLGGDAETSVTNVQLSDGRLRGRANGRLHMPDVRPIPYTLDLDVRLLDGRLTGTISAAAPPPRYQFHLASWVELQRDMSQ